MGICRVPLFRLSDLTTQRSETVRSYLRRDSDGTSVGFYNSGRTALYHGLRTQFSEAGTVLLPSCICSAAMPPFSSSEFDVEFYDVQRSATPVVADVSSKITADTVGIVTVNYFGFPAKQFEAIDRLCRDNDLLHVEDGAHSLLSRSGSQLLGTRADWGIASIHKLLPVPDGGVLYAPEAGPGIPARDPGVPELDFVARNAVKRLDSWMFDGSIVQQINERSRSQDEDYTLETGGMSPLTDRLLRSVNAERIIDRRRRNYRALTDAIAGTPNVEALFPDLPDGVCPFVFPVIADNPPAIKQRLHSANVPVRRWPYLPRTVRGNDAFTTANYLSNHVLTIPVHQSIDRSELVEKVRGSLHHAA